MSNTNDLAERFAAQVPADEFDVITYVRDVKLAEPIILEDGGKFVMLTVEVIVYADEDAPEYRARGWRTQLTSAGFPDKRSSPDWAYLPAEVAKAVFAKVGLPAHVQEWVKA